jgi:hypothetical protein
MAHHWARLCSRDWRLARTGAWWRWWAPRRRTPHRGRRWPCRRAARRAHAGFRFHWWTRITIRSHAGFA